MDSFLREYNRRSIANLTIHEAMPGHYLQIAHSNRYPSVLRAMLGSGPFIEGWAVYAERVMREQGFRGDDPLMKLVQLKWYLRAVTNAIMDSAIHVDGMTRDEAMKLMTQTGFQEEREAAGKWVRAQLSSAQLSTYFVGYQEHADMRASRRATHGRALRPESASTTRCFPSARRRCGSSASSCSRSRSASGRQVGVDAEQRVQQVVLEGRVAGERPVFLAQEHAVCDVERLDLCAWCGHVQRAAPEQR